jgi:hypothetical protein
LLSELRWSNVTNFIPTVHEFDASSSGVKSGIPTEDLNEVDYFKTMVPYHIVDVLTTETNRYAHQVISKYDKDDFPYGLKRWTNTTRNEMYTFIALMMLMARNRRYSLKEYWSNDVLLNSRIVSATMARDRFISILRMLHFSNTETEGDRLHMVRDIFNKF